MRVHLSRPLLLGFVMAIIILLVLGFLAYRYFSGFISTAQLASHSRRILFVVENTESLCYQLENKKLQLTITPSNEGSAELNDLQQKIERNFLELDSLTRGNPEHQRTMDQLKDSWDEQASLEDSAGNGTDQRHVTLFHEYTGTILNKLQAIRTGENQLASVRSIQTGQQFQEFLLTSGVLFFFIIVTLGLLSYGINATLRARNASEEKLRQAEIQTKKINDELESFTYSVSHDLRAPLRSINGFAQVLQEDYANSLDEEGKETIEVIMRNARKMGHLIDDLLNFSRSGRIGMTRSTVSMEWLVKSIVDELLLHENDRKISINFKPLGKATVDINLFRQVWINLVSNAIKYTRNKEDAQIEIGTLNDEDKGPVYYIKDNGAGFDMKYAPKLFGVFQRLHKASEFEGTGVGLALVKRIIERHNGQVWATSTIGQGSTFFFTLNG